MQARTLKAALIVNAALLCLLLAAGARAATAPWAFAPAVALHGAEEDLKDWREGWRGAVLRIDASGDGATLDFGAAGVTLDGLRVTAVQSGAVKGASGWGAKGGAYRLTLFNTAMETIYSQLRAAPGKGGHDDVALHVPDVAMLHIAVHMAKGATAHLMDIDRIETAATPALAVAAVPLPAPMPLLAAAFAALGLAQCVARRRRHAG